MLSSKVDSVGGDRSIAEGSTTDQSVSGKAESNYRGNQYLQAPASSEIAGAGTVFPIGSLAISANIGINKGGNLATPSVLSGLGLNTGIATSGTSVLVSSNPAQDTVSPFTLSIPLPKSSALTLNEQQLVVFFEQYVATTGKYLTGVLATEDITKDGSIVKVKVRSFGTYQAAYLTIPISGSTSKTAQASDFVTTKTEPATITSFTSSSANGLYAQGQIIYFDVHFSKMVTVTGSPVIKLNIPTGANAVYRSGSGTDKLQFSYEVKSADVVSKLDYASATPFELGTAKIADSDGTLANLNVAAPGTAGSLSSSSQIQVNGTSTTITNVTSIKADGAYTVGTTIKIDMTFSDPVTVSGTPKLKLATGSTTRYALYSGGTSTNTISFTYDVMAGDTSEDLDYESTSALQLNGGSLTDSATNNVALTLPAPGSAGSLGANKNIVIDTTSPSTPVIGVASGLFRSTFSTHIAQGTTADTHFKEFHYSTSGETLNCSTGGTVSDAQPTSVGISATSTLTVIACDTAGNASTAASALYTFDLVSPTVAGVSSTSADGAYTTGATIAVTVTFSEAVVVSGSPTLQLNTGNSTSRLASYTSGTGPTLTFNYTVQSGDTSQDLDYVSASSLSIAGGATIKDAAGNDATLTLPSPGQTGSLAASKNLIVDTTLPDAPTISVSSKSFSANFSTSIVQSTTADLNFKELRYVLDAVSALSCSSGTSATSGASVGITGTATLRVVSCDLAGNKSSEASALYTLDNTAPTVQSVSSSTANGTYKVGDTVSITVTFSEPVVVSGTPQLSLETGTTHQVASYASGSGSTVLVFTYVVHAGDSSNRLDVLSTAALSGGSIVDAANNAANLTLPTVGGAQSLGGLKSIVIDGVAPAVTSVSASNGTVYPNDTVSITVTFSEPITLSGTTGTPSLALATTPTQRSAIFSSISGTTMVFTYTVSEGDTAADLDYVSASSLTLNGKTLTDAAGNNAVLTLSMPGLAGSLGYTSGVIVKPTRPPVISLAGIPILPVKPGLTTLPSAVFSLSRNVDSVQLYQDDACTTTLGAPTGSKSGGTQLTVTPTGGGLPPSGTYTIAAIATVSGVPSLCKTIGTYTTGVHKVVVATNSAGPTSWACAIVNGGLKCWGSNNKGQLGVGSITNQKVPTMVFPANSGVIDVALNADWNSTTANSTCAITGAITSQSPLVGGVKCWGDNSLGQLGDGTTTYQTSPPSTAILSSASSIYSSTGTVCALSGGALSCWGKNGGSTGSTGTANWTATSITTPTSVASLSGVSDVSMADGHTCVVASGAVYCWGINSYGVLGDGTYAAQASPVNATGLTSGATKVSTDASTTCAIISGNVKCWGLNTKGQVGDNTTTTQSSPVATNSAITNASDVIAGFSSMAFFSGSSTFKAWGDNLYNQLYATTPSYSTSPISPSITYVPNSSTVTGYGTSRAEGTADVVCLMISGGVQCRGHNIAASYLGIGNSGFVVPIDSGVTQVDASTQVSCAVVSNGANVMCWGAGSQGQLGNNAVGISTTAVSVSNILN